jgi:hypothetical protein
MDLELLPLFFTPKGSNKQEPVFDQIARAALWTLTQKATSKHTFEVFVAILLLPGATTKRGWRGPAVSMNRLNEAHRRATRRYCSFDSTKRGLTELVKLRLATATFGKRRRLESLILHVKATSYPMVGEVDPSEIRCTNGWSTPNSGAESLQKPERYHSGNRSTIDIGIKGEVAVSKPHPVPSPQNRRAPKPPAGGGAPKVAVVRDNVAAGTPDTPAEEQQRRELLLAQAKQLEVE